MYIRHNHYVAPEIAEKMAASFYKSVNVVGGKVSGLFGAVRKQQVPTTKAPESTLRCE